MKEVMLGIASYPKNWTDVKVVLEHLLLQVTEENPLIRIYWNILDRTKKKEKQKRKTIV